MAGNFSVSLLLNRFFLGGLLGYIHSVCTNTKQRVPVQVSFFSSVAGNVSALPGAATPPGQPQPSPSQQGQFVFASPVPQIPGQPQAAGPHQGQVTPGQPQFTPSSLMYIPTNVPTSAASFMPGRPFVCLLRCHSSSGFKFKLFESLFSKSIDLRD